jgi:hypothetical protein
MNLTVARHYKLPVQPCNNVTGCWFLYRVRNGISGLHSHNLQDCGFFTVAVLLPLLLVLKTISCKFNHYLNTVYYSKLFELELTVSSALPRYFVCLCVFVQLYLPWKSSNYYMFRYYECILNYPTCNAHAPYYHIGPLLQYSNLSLYVVIGRIFQEKLLTVFLCFNFLQHVCLKILLQRELSEI